MGLGNAIQGSAPWLEPVGYEGVAMTFVIYRWHLEQRNYVRTKNSTLATGESILIRMLAYVLSI